MSSVRGKSRVRDDVPLYEGGDVRSLLRTEEGRKGWDALREHPDRAILLWDLNGATLELVPLGGTPQLDPDVRRELPQLGERYAFNGILTGWAYLQVSRIGLAVPYCHVWGQLACEHWNGEVHHELVPPPSGLSMAHDRLRELVNRLRLDRKCIYVRSHSLAFRFPVDTDPKVVDQLVGELGDVAEAAGDLTLLQDRGLVKLTPAGLDKRIALRRILDDTCVPFEPSVVMNVGDAPDRVIMEELDRMRREGTPTFKVGVRNLRDGVDLFVPGPPRGDLPFIRALARTRQ
jgi:hypothetical protein